MSSEVDFGGAFTTWLLVKFKRKVDQAGFYDIPILLGIQSEIEPLDVMLSTLQWIVIHTRGVHDNGLNIFGSLKF